MYMVNIMVTDFAGRDRSTLIETINEFYAKPPYNQETRSIFSTISIDEDTRDEVQICFFLVPPSIEGEALWEDSIEQALAYVFAIPGGDPQVYAEAAALMQTFRAYADLPLVAVIYDAPHLDDEDIRQQLNNPQGCRITHFVPEKMAIDSIARDVVIAIINANVDFLS